MHISANHQIRHATTSLNTEPKNVDVSDPDGAERRDFTYVTVDTLRQIGLDEESIQSYRNSDVNRLKEISRTFEIRREMGDIYDSYRENYARFEQDLYQNSPDILKKDWDFNVSPRGEINIVEGQDKLSSQEQKFLKSTIEMNELAEPLKRLSNLTNEAVYLFRREGNYQPKAVISQFDLNENTTFELLQGRDLAQSLQKDHGFGRELLNLRDVFTKNNAVVLYDKPSPSINIQV